MENIAVENMSEYLMISMDDADKFYEWALDNNFRAYDCIEKWNYHWFDKRSNTTIDKTVSIYHVYELYKQTMEKENLSLIKNTAE